MSPDDRGSNLFSGRSPWGSIVLFAIAVLIGLIAAAKTSLSGSAKFWLIVGWLIAVVVVATCAFNAAAALYPDDPQTTREDAVPQVIVSYSVILVVMGLVFVSFFTLSAAAAWSSSILWSLANLLFGGCTGFLFGVPRSHSVSSTNDDRTPIEMVSDWLTKIIVGVGLVDLKKIPHQFHRYAEFIGQGMASTASMTQTDGRAAFALAIVIYFGLVGAISGYILTQFYLRNLGAPDVQPNARVPGV